MRLLQTTVEKITPVSETAREAARKHILDLTMPTWALGRVLDLAVDLAGIYGSADFSVRRKRVMLMAGDHGIVEEGVCPSPQDVTRQMMLNFVSGTAGINVLTRLAGASLTIADVGVAGDLTGLGNAIEHRKIRYGTKNFAYGPAMTIEEAVRSVETGIELTLAHGDDTDVFATGDMGIGNTSPSTAILSVFSGLPVEKVVGPGGGLPPERVQRKAEIIQQGLLCNQPDKNDGLDVLAKVGGLEIGAIAGTILAAASLKKPVLVDGFISTAGALIAQSLSPESTQYMILAHGSAEPGHVVMAELLGKKPLLDLNMRLGEGTGSALAMNLLDAASALMHEMATFSSAKVSDRGLMK